jgi:hypothetical protein
MQASGGELPEVQLLALFLEVNGDIDTQFQVWVSITFALLVASFVAGARLSRVARTGLVGLYLCAAAVLLIRYLRAGSYLGYVLELYALYDIAPPGNLGISGTAGLLRMTLFTVGSGVAALSVLFPALGKISDALRDEERGGGDPSE